MRKRIVMLSAGILVAGSILFTSCIGSFGLTGKVYSWNKSMPKWVDELVFLAMCIVPVYEISLFIDAVILNTIEFWTGNNPVAFQPGEKRSVETDNGVYMVEAIEGGYTITKEGEEGSMNLIYDKEANSCYIETNGHKFQVR